MKIDLTIDVKVTWLHKVGALAALFGAVLLVNRFAAAEFEPWMQGDPLTSAKLNSNFQGHEDRLAAIEAAVPVITEWQPYTPALTVNQTTVTVGNTTTVGAWRRVGDSAEVTIKTTFSDTPGTGAAFYSWSLPPGLSFDLAKLDSMGGYLGGGMTNQGLGNNVALSVYDRSPTTVSLTANGAVTYYVNDTVPFLWGGSDTGYVYFRFTAPIDGWDVATP